MESPYYKKLRRITFYCEKCAIDLPKERKHAVYCSDECAKSGIGIKMRKGVKDLNPIECPRCSKTFIKKNKDHVFCNKQCYNLQQEYVLEQNKISKFSIFKRDSFKCIYCGQSSIEDGVTLNVEHIIPLHCGGKSVINNLITSCSACNVSKGKISLPEDITKRILSVLESRNNFLNRAQITDLIAEAKRMEYERGN